jgi:hypothetical protein
MDRQAAEQTDADQRTDRQQHTFSLRTAALDHSSISCGFATLPTNFCPKRCAFIVEKPANHNLAASRSWFQTASWDFILFSNGFRLLPGTCMGTQMVSDCCLGNQTPSVLVLHSDTRQPTGAELPAGSIQSIFLLHSITRRCPRLGLHTPAARGSTYMLTRAFPCLWCQGLYLHAHPCGPHLGLHAPAARGVYLSAPFTHRAVHV